MAARSFIPTTTRNSFMMQKSLLAAAMLCLAGGAQAQATSNSGTSGGSSSSSVTLYGLLDMSVRLSNAQGATGKDTAKMVSSGGLSPSRWGISIVEDLGDGLFAIGNLDSRFQVDTGTPDPGAYFQQSWVGLQSKTWGRVTMGRQYNVLFDVTVNTFAPFLTVGPFLNAYKPEVALALGVRNDNQIKYQVTKDTFTLALQASAGEGQPFGTTTGKSLGGTLRYSSNGLGAGAGYLEREDTAKRKAKAMLLGAAYTTGPWYVNAQWASDRFDDGLNTAVLLVGSGLENVIAPARPGQLMTRARKRDLWSMGGTYLVSPFLTVGAQYWSIKQSFHTPGAPDGKAQFAALLVDYLLSKRTDLYATIERTHVDDLQLTNTTTATPNGATGRTTLMAGVRHRF
jgi:predicted porin